MSVESKESNDFDEEESDEFGYVSESRSFGIFGTGVGGLLSGV